MLASPQTVSTEQPVAENGGWSPSAEFEIITSLAKHPFNEAAILAAQKSLTRKYDPQIVMDLIGFHRLPVHISRHVNQWPDHGLDRSFRLDIARAGAYGENQGSRQIESLHAIKEVFDRHNIDLMPIKGPATAKRLYDDPKKRTLYDIDILVRPSDTGRAVQVLMDMGFVQVKQALAPDFTPKDIRRLQNWGSNIGFYHPDKDDVLVELHWRPGRYQREFPVSTEDIWSKAQPLNIEGEEYLAMDPVHELLFLASHGCKHEFKRLHWLLDIATIADDDKFDWNAAVDLARALKVENYLGLSLRLAAQVYKSQIPGPARLLTKSPMIRKRAAHILRNRYSNTPQNDTPWQEAKMEWRNSGLVGGFSHRVRTIMSHLAPGPDDWNWVKLPGFLSWLYYPLRLVRIVFAVLFSSQK